MQTIEHAKPLGFDLFGDPIFAKEIHGFDAKADAMAEVTLSDFANETFLTNFALRILEDSDTILATHLTKRDGRALDPDLKMLAISHANSTDQLFEQGEVYKHGLDVLDTLLWIFAAHRKPSLITFIAACNEVGRDWQTYQERIASTMKPELVDLVNFVLAVRGQDSAKRIVMKLADVIDLYHLLPDASQYH